MPFRRRRRFSRRPREPLRWFRRSFLNAPFQTSFLSPRVTIAQIFFPTTLAPTGVDETFTVRRLIINRHPVLSIPQNFRSLLGSPLTFSLTWYLMLRSVTDTFIPVDPDALFQEKVDIIQGGTLMYQVNVAQPDVIAPTNAGLYPPWFLQHNEHGGNWIDTKVARRVRTNETLALWTQANTYSDCFDNFPWTSTVEDFPCVVHDWDASVLYQRTLKR